MQQSRHKVLSLFIAQTTEPKTLSCDSLTCDEGGVIGDKHHGKDPLRSVLITSAYAYTLAETHGIEMVYGSLGENILTDFDLRSLKPGDRLRMGEVVFEVAQNCTLCNHLSQIDRKLPKLLREDRGIFARVVREGTLRQGDPVSLAL